MKETHCSLYLVLENLGSQSVTCILFCQAFPRDLGEKQSLLIKLLLGFLLISGLVLLIWGPLLLISFIGATSQPNQPTEVSIKLNLAGFEVREGGRVDEREERES